MKFLHIHIYNNPILADYVGFSTRDVVWECRCGCRKLVRESRAFGSPFSTDFTVGLTTDEMNQVLERRESEFLLTMLDIHRRSMVRV